MKSIDDTSNFDDFPEVDLKIRELLISLWLTLSPSSFILLVISTIQIAPNPTPNPNLPYDFSTDISSAPEPLLQFQFFCSSCSISNSALARTFPSNGIFTHTFTWNFTFTRISLSHFQPPRQITTRVSRTRTGFSSTTLSSGSRDSPREGPPSRWPRRWSPLFQNEDRWHFWTLTPIFPDKICKVSLLFSSQDWIPHQKWGNIVAEWSLKFWTRLKKQV